MFKILKEIHNATKDTKEESDKETQEILEQEEIITSVERKPKIRKIQTCYLCDK